MTALAKTKPITKPRTALLADGIGEQTCVGVLFKDFPLQSGNCFDVTFPKSAKQHDLRVLNFCVENLRELIRTKQLAWPVKVVKATNRHCYIHDARIPNNWYSRHVCSTCTPLALMTINQQLERFREFERGDRTKIRSGILKGGEMVHTKIETKQRALKVKWSAEAMEDFKAADPPLRLSPGGIILPPRKEPK